MDDARYKYELKIALMAKQIKSLELTLNVKQQPTNPFTKHPL
jgi:hypothetical protein